MNFLAEYEEMKKSTQKGETVYRDCTEICNKGEARYQLKSVENEGWTLTDEFAASVCGLTVKFKKREEKKKYFDFLKYWGTVSEINWKSVLLMKVNRNTAALIAGALSRTTDQDESNKIWSN